MSKLVAGRHFAIARLLSSAIALLLGWGGVLGTACSLQRARSSGAGLRVSSEPFAVDIPVPVDFDLVERASDEQSSAGVRFVRHRYAGRADKSAVRAFYREQMPLVRWSCISDRSAGGRYTMRFTRGDEACTVEISGGRAGAPGHVHVDVRISPRTETVSEP